VPGLPGALLVRFGNKFQEWGEQMEITNHVLTRWKCAGRSVAPTAFKIKCALGTSKRRHGIGIRAAAVLATALFAQTVTERSAASYLRDLKQKLQQDSIAFAMFATFGDFGGAFYSVPTFYRIISKLKQKIQNMEKSFFGTDPLYGTVTALGSNADNTVYISTIGAGSAIFASGWSDTDAGYLSRHSVDALRRYSGPRYVARCRRQFGCLRHRRRRFGKRRLVLRPGFETPG
jgi:hypothetical protein